MAPAWIEQKRRYRQYKARVEQLPPTYRAAIEALERYMQFFGPGTAASMLALLEDLAECFEESVANGASVRAIIGDDPVEFAEAFLRNYPEGQWLGRERERLTKAVDEAASDLP